MINTLSPMGMDCRSWNGVEIQRRPSDGYVNATAMCQAGGKRWPDYIRLERTRAYIAALASVVGICTTGNHGPIQTIQGGSPHLQGTWIHPRLAVDLARWISPAFAVWMDGWLLDVMRGQLQGAGDAAAGMASSSMAAPVKAGVSAVAFAAPAAWSQAVELYVAEVQAEMEGLSAIDIPRSLRFARPLAQHFMQWLINRYAQLVIPGGDGNPLAPLQPITPSTPRRRRQYVAPLPVADEPWDVPRPEEIVVSRRLERSQALHPGPFHPGQRIAAPELARILGVTSHRINEWSRHHGVGAMRDGWRLIGRGKIACGDMGSTVPPGKASWLFERV